jgi:hypothetical protein
MFPVDIVSFTQLCEGIWSSSKKINDQQPFQLLQFKNKKFKKFKKIRSGGGFRPKHLPEYVLGVRLWSGIRGFVLSESDLAAADLGERWTRPGLPGPTARPTRLHHRAWTALKPPGNKPSETHWPICHCKTSI